jgi:hypothetical protein
MPAEAAQLSLRLKSTVTEFNHIHIHENGDWVCGRSMAYEDQELIRCEARDSDEQEACRRCAGQLLGYFGDPMHVH